MEKKIRGFNITYNFDAIGGVSYLTHGLSYIPARELFIKAKEKGQIEFRDTTGRGYSLIAKLGSDFIVRKIKLE